MTITSSMRFLYIFEGSCLLWAIPSPTVAVWTQKQFIPLLTRLQGSQCVKKSELFLQIKLLSSCPKGQIISKAIIVFLTSPKK